MQGPLSAYNVNRSTIRKVKRIKNYSPNYIKDTFVSSLLIIPRAVSCHTVPSITQLLALHYTKSTIITTSEPVVYCTVVAFDRVEVSRVWFVSHDRGSIDRGNIKCSVSPLVNCGTHCTALAIALHKNSHKWSCMPRPQTASTWNFAKTEGKTCGGETFLVMRGGFHFAVIIFWLLQFYCRTCRWWWCDAASQQPTEVTGGWFNEYTGSFAIVVCGCQPGKSLHPFLHYLVLIGECLMENGAFVRATWFILHICYFVARFMLTIWSCKLITCVRESADL